MRGDLEPVGAAVDLDRGGRLEQAFIHQKGVAVYRKHVIRLSLLVQSKAKLRTASPGSHIDTDGGDFLFLSEVLIQKLFRAVGQIEHIFLLKK